MGRLFLIGAQVTATVLFVWNTGRIGQQHWTLWFVPMVLIVLVVVNSFWFTRAVSWTIFALAFFGLLVILSAFTLRWRLEPGFNAAPFYRSLGMYTAFAYISLAQIKIKGGQRSS